MMYCCISVDYLSQLERTGVGEVGTFLDDLRSIGCAFGATVGTRKTPLVLAFPGGGLFDGVQTAEALCRLVESCKAYEHFLRGASLVAHDSETPELALSYAKLERSRAESAYLYTLSPEAKAHLSAYFPPGEEAWAPPIHSLCLGDADAKRLWKRPRLAATLDRALSKSGKLGPRLVHLETGAGYRSLDTLVPDIEEKNDSMLIIDGRKTRPISFSPLLEAIKNSVVHADLDDSIDKSAFLVVASSSFSGRASEALAKGCAAYIDTWLDRFGSMGGMVFCESPAMYSAEAIELIAKRLSNNRGSEQYLTLSEGALLDAWAGSWAARVPSEVADTDDRASALSEALGSTGKLAGDALLLRFKTIAGAPSVSKTKAGLPRLLKMLPREASLYLFILSIIDNELSADELAVFVAALGLKPEGQTLLSGLLSRAGLIDPLVFRYIIQPLDSDVLQDILGIPTAENIRERFSAYLIDLYHKNRIRPSLGFLKRVGENQKEERLLYDCLFEEIMRPDAASSVDPAFLSQSSACIYRFWSALSVRDRLVSEAVAASAEERITGVRGKAIKALIRAELAYAHGDPERASKGAREAMLALGKGAPPRLEARSQRMMGLSALALGKPTEAADYITNAQELAESAGDEYERMVAAFAKAVVEFLSGGLVRSSRAASHTEEAASRLFRIDYLAAILALRGRIDLELGAYDEAQRRFLALEELAETFTMQDARVRASIWRARCLSYSGQYDDAISLLEEHDDDLEARVFRGELEILRGRPRDARPWLEAPDEPPIRAFDPPDSIDWSSLLSEFEGRCIGFDAANAPLSMLRTALSLFARGLDERDPACALELHNLTRSGYGETYDPGMGLYSFFCYLLEERLVDPPIDKQTVLSRAFKILQQRAGRIENRAQRALYMEKNTWNRRLMEAARTHKFI
ncbi:MAG: hypothetical protein RBT62_05420 [Spirochaetia bacterium]|nr:hypothetical protein [Spirochaetia bacterium]